MQDLGLRGLVKSQAEIKHKPPRSRFLQGSVKCSPANIMLMQAKTSLKSEKSQSHTKRYFTRTLRPLIRKSAKKLPIIGFDIETHNKNRSFTCGSVSTEDKVYSFFDKKEMGDFLISARFHNHIAVASNLAFDFFGLFFNDTAKKFSFVFRGSQLIVAKAYFAKGTIAAKATQRRNKITFLDTSNYAPFFSVDKLGKLIGKPKLRKPEFLGKKPKNKKQWKQLLKYNRRDAVISRLSLEWMYDFFDKISADRKFTIASVAMNKYRRACLPFEISQPPVDVLLEQFDAYYGGRCEAFSRGKIKNMKIGDINSMYPFVMLKEYPDPNTLNISTDGSIETIKSFHGISDCLVKAPDGMKYPLLPFRDKSLGKLIFPVGIFRAWQSHIELRKAISLGYEIIKIFKTQYYTGSMRPFEKYVNELWPLRQAAIKAGKSEQVIIKLLLNGLYGKFGQKFMDRDNLIQMPESREEIEKYDDFEPLGCYARIGTKIQPPACFCVPIWALHVTAYARLELYEHIISTQAIYCDTDSVITACKFKESKDLGGLKIEAKIKRGIIVRPKFYFYENADDKPKIKIKGIDTHKFDFDDAKNLILRPRVDYWRIVKIRESLRHGYIPNETRKFFKRLAFNDDKRAWAEKFDPDAFQESRSITKKYLNDG